MRPLPAIQQTRFLAISLSLLPVADRRHEHFAPLAFVADGGNFPAAKIGAWFQFRHVIDGGPRPSARHLATSMTAEPAGKPQMSINLQAQYHDYV